MRITKGQRIFAVFNYIFLTLLALSCILPILHLLAVSLSSKVASDNNMVGLIPVGFNTDSYKYLIQGNTFFRSFGVSVYRAVLGTAINILLIVLLAYPLSKNKEAARLYRIAPVRHDLFRWHGAVLSVHQRPQPIRYHLGARPSDVGSHFQRHTDDEFHAFPPPRDRRGRQG